MLIGTVPPFLLKTADNPEGVDGQAFEDIKAAIVQDEVAVTASPFATYACVDSWLTDFRDDLPKIDVPVPAIHGSADRILPFEATAGRLPALVADLRLVSVEGGPHNICWTHHEEVNQSLLEFLAARRTRHRACRKPTSSWLTWAACVQMIACPPSGITARRASASITARRFPVAPGGMTLS